MPSLCSEVLEVLEVLSILTWRFGTNHSKMKRYPGGHRWIFMTVFTGSFSAIQVLFRLTSYIALAL